MRENIYQEASMRSALTLLCCLKEASFLAYFYGICNISNINQSIMIGVLAQQVIILFPLIFHIFRNGAIEF
jgi:hypothetical protein